MSALCVVLFWLFMPQLAGAAAWLDSERPLNIERCDRPLTPEEITSALRGAANDCFVAQDANDSLKVGETGLSWFRIASGGVRRDGVLALRELGNRVAVAHAVDLVEPLLLQPNAGTGWASGVVLPWPAQRTFALLSIEGGAHTRAALTWQSTESWMRFSHQRVRFATFAHSLMFAMVVIAICFYLRLRDPMYALFAVSLGFQLLFFMHSTGEGLAWPVIDSLTALGLRWSWFCLMFAMALRMEFAVRFCDLPRFVPLGPRLLRGIGAAYAAMAVGSSFLPPLWLSQLGNGLILLNIFVIAPVTFIAWRRGSRFAGYYLLAIAATYLFASARIVQLLLGLPYVGWIEQGVVLTMSLAPLILTVGLADFALSPRQERDAAIRGA